MLTADLHAELIRRLDALADEARRGWWTNYLKGSVAFRGVTMAGTRSTVRAMWREHDLGTSEDPVGTALSFFGLDHCEDKLAGVLLLAEHLLDRLTIDDVPRLAAPFLADQVYDWNTCDWYAVKVLGPFIVAGDDERRRASAIADWRFSGGLWQRRAAAVAFVDLASHGDARVPGLIDLVISICEANVADPTRWSQTSVGWVLRELSGVAPDVVRSFVDAHPELSSEARRAALARL